MKKLGCLLVLLTGLLIGQMQAQSYAFGVKGGLTMGVQQWNNFERDPLIKPHGIIFIESYSDEEPFSLFAQLGYYQKGSAIRNRNFFNGSGQVFRAPTYEFVFQNISLVLGGKQKFDFSGKSKVYYLFGLRGDYTIDTNLDKFDEINKRTPIFPSEGGRLVRKFNYGVSFGGGIDLPFSELIGAVFELAVHPDFSYQYEQPELAINYQDQYGRTWSRIPERKIRNLAFELTLGFRFLHKIEYID